MDHLQNVMGYFDQQQPLCAEHDRISKDLYKEFGVKAGLRDENGKGVLAGLTNISDIRAFKYVDGVKYPADGQLLYRGYDVKDLIRGSSGSRFAFEEAGYFQGHREGGDHYLNTFMKPGVASFMDREAAENDPSHKQIIAYAIFCHQGRILHYTRGGSGGEARLHDKGSIGIGGHINPVDRQSGHDDVSTYLAGVEREIREELVIDGNCTQRVLGVINDDTNDVGAVHLGIVHLFELDTDRVRANEAALANLRFVSPEELSGEMFEKLETWSQLALELFKNRGA